MNGSSATPWFRVLRPSSLLLPLSPFRRPPSPVRLITRRESLKVIVGAGAAAATASLSDAIAADATAQPQRTSVVLNPYQGIDWRACGRHKAALNLHTLQSDGYHSVLEVVNA